MTAEIPATAEGDLSKTPLAHLCVYMLEKELTGVLFLNPPNAETHVVRFIRGVPVKTRPGDPYMLLGKMLIDAGHIDKKTLDNALAANGRLGDVLMLSGRLDPEVLDATLEAQFLARMVRLYSLPPETTYQYFDGHEELASWGGAPSKVDPFALLWAGIAAHGDKSTRMDETLAKLSGASLTLHEKSSPLRFGFDAAAREVVDLIALDPTKLEDLAGLLGKEEAFVRRVIYALLILRQIPIRDGVMPVQPAESIASLGRVRLRAKVHRMGAAVEDEPGDGERRITIRKKSVIKPLDLRNLPPDSVDPTSSGEVQLVVEEDEPPSDSDVRPVSSVPGGREERRATAPSAKSSDGEQPDSSPAIRRFSAAALQLPDEEISTVTERSSGQAKPAAKVEPGDPPRPSYSGFSGEALRELVTQRIAARNYDAAEEACAAACQNHPEELEWNAFLVWVRVLRPGADLKALSLELDDVVRRDANLVDARYFRAMLRKRLGDDPGAKRDLQMVLEITPEHADAEVELRAMERKSSPPPAAPTGLLSRLFRR